MFVRKQTSKIHRSSLQALSIYKIIYAFIALLRPKQNFLQFKQKVSFIRSKF